MRRALLTLVVTAGLAHGQGGTPPPPKAPPQPAPMQGRGAPPVQQPTGQSAVQRRRALDIRAQAPAPEVVTIRPREIPEFSRSLLAPALYQPPAAGGGQNSGTVVIFPGTVPVVASPTPPNPKPPAE